VTVAVDAVVYYRISNPRISVVNVENAARSTQLLAQTTLRNILGTKTLSEILTDRESISSMMQVSQHPRVSEIHRLSVMGSWQKGEAATPSPKFWGLGNCPENFRLKCKQNVSVKALFLKNLGSTLKFGAPVISYVGNLQLAVAIRSEIWSICWKTAKFYPA